MPQPIYLRGIQLDLRFLPSAAGLDSLDLPDDPYRGYWADGAGRRLLGWGLAVRVGAEGAARFAQLAAGAVQLRGAIRPVGLPPGLDPGLLPFGLGFGFWPHAEWPGYPAAWLALHRLTLDAAPGRPARLWAAAGTAEEAGALLDRMRRQLAAPPAGSYSPFGSTGAAGPAEPGRTLAANLAPATRRTAASPAALGSPLGTASAADAPPASLLAQVERAVAALRAGRAGKLVLATERRLSLAALGLSAHSPAALLAARACAEPDAFHFLVAPGRDEAWLGASPERLLAIEAGRLVSMALAGSRPRSPDAAADEALGQDLLSSPKDGREHALVVEDLVRRLADQGLAARPGEARLRRLRSLQHLETSVEAILPPQGGPDLLSLAGALHPTPALGGWPREEALRLLAELEDLSLGRGLYGGGIGWIDGRGEGDVTVGIRGLRLHGAALWAYAGAGLLPESDPAAEAAEITAKLAATSAGLGLVA